MQKLSNPATGTCLSFDGTNVTLVDDGDDGDDGLSWSVEVDLTSGTRSERAHAARIRPLVDAEFAARYLRVSDEGAVDVAVDGDIAQPPTLWRNDFGGTDGAPWGPADRDIFLRADVDGPLCCVPLIEDEKELFLWVIADRKNEPIPSDELRPVDGSGRETPGGNTTIWRHGTGQGGWAMCMHCGALIWSAASGQCMEGANFGRPHRASTERFLLQRGNPFATGGLTWRHCLVCGVLFDGPLALGPPEDRVHFGMDSFFTAGPNTRAWHRWCAISVAASTAFDLIGLTLP